MQYRNTRWTLRLFSLIAIGHTTFPVPDPFLVMATQNPIESEGTYPLPEAQVDRFMLKVVIGYPQHDEELTVVQRQLVEAPELRQALSLEELQSLQRAVFDVYVDPALVAYTVTLAEATREPASHGLPELVDYVAFGASPRGPISVVQAARALALVRGRDEEGEKDRVDDALHDDRDREIGVGATVSPVPSEHNSIQDRRRVTGGLGCHDDILPSAGPVVRDSGSDGDLHLLRHPCDSDHQPSAPCSP